MKSLQKVTRVQLKINNIEEHVFLGIVSAEPDYKLSFILNKKFKISLKNTSPIIIPEKLEQELSFSRFSNTGTSSGLIFTLISNRSGNSYLLKKLKNVDYLLQVHDPDNDINITTSLLKEIDAITAIFIIDIKSLKDRNVQYLIH